MAVTPNRTRTLRELLLCLECCDINVESQEKQFSFLKAVLFLNAEAMEEMRKWL